ncbi:MAG: Glycerophosphocholine phosphodiesterase [Sclerophora amabilis]|nr:MAG: Glycerophosphocholine phosphodiesterase [Sclerophora amabilis]
MKFGRSLHEYQVPEWASFYINYEGSKRLFKAACTRAREQETEADFTELFAALSRDIEKVERFYVEKYLNISQKAQLLHTRYGISSVLPRFLRPEKVDPYEIGELLGSAIELRKGLEKLLWYGKVNRDGFLAIFRKLDRIRSSNNLHFFRDESRIYDLDFATQRKCLYDLERVNRSITIFTRASEKSQSRSSHISLFLEEVCNRLSRSIDSDEAYFAIREDDSSFLDDELLEPGIGEKEPSAGAQAYLLPLLQFSILQESRNCIEKLLSQVNSLRDENFDDKDNCFHRLPFALELRQKMKDQQGQQLLSNEAARPLHGETRNYPLLTYVLDRLRTEQRVALTEVDSFMRTPLHYAATYGLAGVVREYLKHMPDPQQLTAADAILSQDCEGYTPLHLAVIGGYPAVTNALLKAYGERAAKDQMAKDQKLQTVLGPLLAIALKTDFAETVQILIAHCTDMSNQGADGETALYIAAQHGREDYVEAILQSSSCDRDVLDIPNTVHGRTPLSIASIEGHLSIVRLLLKAGASQGICDFAGWAAKEHAVFRGHRKIAELLIAANTSGLASASCSTTGFVGSPFSGTGLTYAMQRKEQTLFRQALTNDAESCLLVTLGPSSTRTNLKGVDLSPGLSDRRYAAHPETGYSLEVVAVGATGSRKVVELPMLEDMANKPWLFTAKDPAKVKLVFNIFRISDYRGESTFCGSGIALVHTLKEGLSSKQESLRRDYTIPILEKATLRLLGSVTFSLVMVTPLAHPPTTPREIRGFWTQGGPTQIVGHRGSGANSAKRTNLQIGENTIQVVIRDSCSFGGIVCRDVQLTRDLIPVIFHNHVVTETGGDTPLHTLSLDQFMHLSKAQSPRGDLSNTAETRYLERTKNQAGRRRRPRSSSLNAYDDIRSEDLVERMKLTLEFTHSAIKGNLRGHSIQEPSSTLEDLLVKLPKSIAFNIELKYPMLWEAEDWDIPAYAMELNVFVDTILAKIYDLGGHRSITLSSFSPEICILLSIKQQQYPVLFISKAGSVPTGDVRASSPQQAIQFAKSWHLAGIVSLCDPFVMCPRLLQYAKSSGLVCGSYGNMNDDPKCAKLSAKIQAEAGLDAIMVNKVRLISETLAEARS